MRAQLSVSIIVMPNLFEEGDEEPNSSVLHGFTVSSLLLLVETEFVAVQSNQARAHVRESL